MNKKKLQAVDYGKEEAKQDREQQSLHFRLKKHSFVTVWHFHNVKRFISVSAESGGPARRSREEKQAATMKRRRTRAHYRARSLLKTGRFVREAKRVPGGGGWGGAPSQG